MKFIPVLLVFALAVTACGSSDSGVPAVAASSAQEAEAAQAVVAEAEGQSPFCRAVDEMVAYPFVDFPFADAAIANAVAVDADAEALALSNASYRAVAAAAPGDAPNIIQSYFSTIPDAVDDALRPVESARLNPDYAPNLIVAGSIRVNDVASFIEGICAEARFEKQPFTPLFTLDPDAMVVPSQPEFCRSLGEAEELFVALEASGGDDETEMPLIELIEPATFTMTGLVGVDANRSTIAFLRAVNALVGSAFEDEETTFTAFLLLQTLDASIIADDLRTMCPEVSDPGPWLVELFTAPSDVQPAQIVTDTVSEGMSSMDGSFSSTTTTGDVSTNTVRNRLDTIGGTVLLESVEVTVSDVFFERSHIDGTARDTDEIFLDVLVSFDRGHQLAASDFSLTAPDGTVFVADADQTVALDEGFVRFPIDRDVEMSAGWSLRLGDETLEL